MDDKTNLTKEKKSQKRIDRQARKNERRRLKAQALLAEEKKIKQKPVKARLAKKSLPGFLAKNVNTILQWLKDYQTLFIMADDFGIQKLDRLSQEKRNLLVQNYVDVGDFILALEQIMQEVESKKISSLEDKEDNDLEIIDQIDQTKLALMDHDL